jgi:hypothetical protein
MKKLALLLALLTTATVRASTTPQALPFTPTIDAASVSANDDWSNVPGITGYLGDIDSGSTNNVDPRTLTADALGAVDVVSNSAVTATGGGVHDLGALSPPSFGLQGSGTADAPSLVLYLDTTANGNVTVAFSAVRVDTDDAPQQLNVQYRVGNSGIWDNVTNGYTADVNDTPTPFSLLLPASADNSPEVQVRIMTTNASGSDSMIGISAISVTGTGTVLSEATTWMGYN